MGIEPMNDRLLIEVLHENEVTQGGLFIPEQAKEKPTRGIVRFVGEGGYLRNGTFRPTKFQVGDKVIFGKHAGSVIKYDGETFRIVMEEDILARVTDEPAESPSGADQ